MVKIAVLGLVTIFLTMIAGSVKPHSTSQDIYITKTYADELIAFYGSDSFNKNTSKYEQLLDKTPQIEFDYETTSSNSRTFQSYFLCGIIDDNSNEYKIYQELFGDYFISNLVCHCSKDSDFPASALGLSLFSVPAYRWK